MRTGGPRSPEGACICKRRTGTSNSRGSCFQSWERQENLGIPSAYRRYNSGWEFRDPSFRFFMASFLSSAAQRFLSRFNEYPWIFRRKMKCAGPSCISEYHDMIVEIGPIKFQRSQAACDGMSSAPEFSNGWGSADPDVQDFSRKNRKRSVNNESKIQFYSIGINPIPCIFAPVSPQPTGPGGIDRFVGDRGHDK